LNRTQLGLIKADAENNSGGANIARGRCFEVLGSALRRGVRRSGVIPTESRWGKKSGFRGQKI